MQDIPSQGVNTCFLELFKRIWDPYLVLRSGIEEQFQFKLAKRKEDAFIVLLETPEPFKGRIWVALNGSPYALAVGNYGGFDIAVKPGTGGFANDILGGYLMDGDNVLKLRFEGGNVIGLNEAAKLKSIFGYRIFGV